MKPSARRVLAALREKPRTTHDLCQPDCGGVRFSARIAELREVGYMIREERCRQGAHLYTLVSSPLDVGRDDLQSGQNNCGPGHGVNREIVPLNAEPGLFDAGEFRRTRSPYEDAA